jgi:hypothetical protein
VVTIISMSILIGSERLIVVNFYCKFEGRGFLPESVAGFMQAITLKPEFLVICVKSPF